MAALYQLAVLGSPTDAQISELEEIVGTAVGMFNLRLGHEVGWEVRPEAFNPDQQRSSAAVFFGATIHLSPTWRSCWSEASRYCR